MKNNIRFGAILLSVLALVATFPVAAEDFLSANDLDPATLTANMKAGAFTLFATAEKPMTVDVMTEALTAEDGEIFNNRVNLKGGGTATWRAVGFTANANAEVSIYSLSSSKTDMRSLIVANAASGAVAAELSAPPYLGNPPKLLTFVIAEAGDYRVYSKDGTMYIYQISVK